MIKINEIPTPSETPSVPQGMPPPPPPKRFGKKLYLLIGLVAVIAVVSAVTLIFLLASPTEGALVPLGLNYSPGEKMTYSMTLTASGMGMSLTVTGTTSMEILSFDGENYTIQQTVKMQSPYSYEASYNITMDKTGRIINFTGLPYDTGMFSSFIGIPGFGSYFQKDQMRVGESFQIPIHVSMSGITMDGTLSYKISEIKNTTIPNCGTYKVFKMEITANNIHATSQSSGVTVSMNINMNGYIYMEYGTCRLIEFSVQESMTGTSMGQPVSMSMTMQMQLTEHIRP